MGLTLYEIRAEILAAELRCTDTETGELDEERFNELTKHLGLEEKALNVAKYVKSLEAEEEALKAEAAKLRERQKAAENRAKSLRRYLRRNLDEGQTFQDPQAEIRWRKKPDRVEVDVDPEKLEERFRQVSYTAKKSELGAALKAGADPKEIGAHIEKGERDVVIR